MWSFYAHLNYSFIGWQIKADLCGCSRDFETCLMRKMANLHFPSFFLFLFFYFHTISSSLQDLDSMFRVFECIIKVHQLLKSINSTCRPMFVHCHCKPSSDDYKNKTSPCFHLQLFYMPKPCYFWFFKFWTTASQVIQPTNDGRQDSKVEAVKESSPTSVFVNSEPIREEQVQNAVKFLSHPKVRGSPVIYRRSFLERKGLTKEEIDEAFRRVPVSYHYLSNWVRIICLSDFILKIEGIYSFSKPYAWIEINKYKILMV